MASLRVPVPKTAEACLGKTWAQSLHFVLHSRGLNHSGLGTGIHEYRLMKTYALVLLTAALTSNAAVIQFGVSPSGTDIVTGLSPSNEVPIVTTSLGSGDVVSGGITFDTDNKILKLAIGYGSAAGFTDLTGPATAMHIHLGAAGQSGGVVASLAPLSFPAVDAAKGGVILGNLQFSSEQASNLLAGLLYVNIHTALNPDGEIRGQLVAVVNAPPLVTCAGDATFECGSPSTFTALVSDPEGDPLTVVWSLNGTPVQTNTVAGGAPSATTPVMYQATLTLGANVLDVMVADSANNTASCSTRATVVDTTPPVITSATASPNSLWPPNHRMVPITLTVRATDSCSRTTWRITRVTSNEATNGLGDGDTAPDWQIMGDHGLKLRAERSGRGNGRVYTVTLQATDTSGNVSTTRNVTIRVPKSQGNGK